MKFMNIQWEKLYKYRIQLLERAYDVRENDVKMDVYFDDRMYCNNDLTSCIFYNLARLAYVQ